MLLLLLLLLLLLSGRYLKAAVPGGGGGRGPVLLREIVAGRDSAARAGRPRAGEQAGRAAGRKVLEGGDGPVYGQRVQPGLVRGRGPQARHPAALRETLQRRARAARDLLLRARGGRRRRDGDTLDLDPVFRRLLLAATADRFQARAPRGQGRRFPTRALLLDQQIVLHRRGRRRL